MKDPRITAEAERFKYSSSRSMSPDKVNELQEPSISKTEGRRSELLSNIEQRTLEFKALRSQAQKVYDSVCSPSKKRIMSASYWPSYVIYLT